MSQSVLEPLRNHYPEAEIWFCSVAPYHNAILGHPCIDNMLIFNRDKGIKGLISKVKFLFKVFKLKFDIVIDLQSFYDSQIVTFCSFAKYRIGRVRSYFPFVYNIKSTAADDDKVYFAAIFLRMLLPLGITNEKIKLCFSISNNDQEYVDNWLEDQNLKKNEFVVITPGSLVQEKKWLAQSYAQLCDIIQKDLDLPVVILGAKEENEDKMRVFDLAKQKPILAFETTLNQAVAIVKRAKLLICNDGAMNHFSCATETKTIAIWGYKYPPTVSCHTYFPQHHYQLYNHEKALEMDNSFGITPEDVINKIKVIFENSIQD